MAVDIRGGVRIGRLMGFLAALLLSVVAWGQPALADVVAPEIERCSVAPTSAADDLLSAACRTNSFVPGTEALMADGSTKPIEDIEIGDWVWAHDPETGETGARQVVDTIIGEGEKQLVDIEVLGDTITATDGHPFWVDDGRWVDADDLEVGDRLLLADGDTAPVAAIEDRSAIRRVHNLTVEGIHTYFIEAGGEYVLVHNCRPEAGILGAYPGHVVDANVPVRRPDGSDLTDFDIELPNAVIQIKSGRGTGAGAQVTRTIEGAGGRPVIVYGPNLGPHVVREIEGRGGLMATSLDELVGVVAP